ncbi:EF-hand domain-containing family member C2 [Seriola lalandi dorsalis]|uniref:EF-hand domain-containing family member C2 n=1 Tax=Seriola lalandi dorsalis TaxID=1841481 RepID=UPI000C6FBA41|nr:EF-hand domain-containing family member C2 [Seriola lalandi dorsalis]
MALPFLPGNSFNKQLGKERFHKSQHFDYSNGVPMLVGSEKPGIGGELLVGQKIKAKYSVYPKGQGSDSPSWVAFDKQALCFEAYFQEAVPEARDETYRIRKCNIFFFLEDDTIQVVEPEYKNSGIPQGTLIRRHRIPLPPPDDDQFYNISHFNLNQQMVLYSRTFTVTSCDSFTRNFLTKLGVHLNDPTTVPDDPYSNLREQAEKNMKPLRPYERRDTLKQFLDHDRKVLRFYCFWDATESTFGDPRELILHYYLADDTIEIREVITPNSGRDSIPKFLRRSKLPKHPAAQVKQPGQTAERTVLNVFSSPNQGKCFILDSIKTGAVQEEFYKDCDLTVGGEMNVFGRRVIIADCDDFTRDYYRSKYGIEDFTPVQYKASPAPKPQRLVPPYNGFGSEEDSLSSCQGLLPKPPQKDFKKFMAKDSGRPQLCFPKANIGNIFSKLRSIPEEGQSEIRKFLTLSDPSNTGLIPYEAFRSLLTGLDCRLSEHEVLVLGRRFSRREQPEVDVGLMLAVAQDLLKKKHFEELPDMTRAFTYHDRHKTGRLSAKETRTICKAFRLPLPENLLGGLLDKFADGDEIDYHALLAGINWMEHPAPPVMAEDILKFDVSARFDAGEAAVKNINYSALLEDVFCFPSNRGDPTAGTATETHGGR